MVVRTEAPGILSFGVVRAAGERTQWEHAHCKDFSRPLARQPVRCRVVRIYARGPRPAERRARPPRGRGGEAAAGSRSIQRSHAFCQGDRMAARSGAANGRGVHRHAVRRQALEPSLAVRLAERRRPRRRIDGRAVAQSQQGHAAARRGSRWARRSADHLPEGCAAAVRSPVARRSALRRQHERARPVSVQRREHDDHCSCDQGARPARRRIQQPLDARRGRERRRVEVVRVGQVPTSTRRKKTRRIPVAPPSSR